MPIERDGEVSDSLVALFRSSRAVGSLANLYVEGNSGYFSVLVRFARAR